VAGSYSGGNKRKLALAVALVSANFSTPCWWIGFGVWEKKS
jgi:hypothetical protein